MEHRLSDFNLQLPIQVRFNDIDGFGHINNAVYQEYFDLGRVHYFNLVLGENWSSKDESLVVVSNKTDFAKPLYLRDELTVYTRVYKIGVKSLRMIQWLVKNGEAFPRVVCDSVMAGFILSKEKGMVIPEEWRQLFNHFEKGNLIQDINQ